MKVITLTAAAATDRQAELQRTLQVTLNRQMRLAGLRETLTAKLQALPTRGRKQEQRIEAEQLAEAIEQIEHGVAGPLEGVCGCIEELFPKDFAGKPALDALTEEVPKLRKDIRLLRRHLARWPSESTVHPYRFKGSTGLTFFDGRELEVGDVVNLTRGQAATMRDRFDEVEESAAQKVS